MDARSHGSGRLDRLYHRFGLGYLYGFFAWGSGTIFVGLGIAMVVLAHGATGSIDAAPQLILIAWACAAPVIAPMVWIVWRDMTPLWAWLRAGRPPEGAEPAWSSLVHIRFLAWHVQLLVAGTWMAPVAFLMVGPLDLQTWAAPLVWASSVVLFMPVFVYLGEFVGATASRPILRDAARIGRIGTVGTGRSVRSRLQTTFFSTTAFAVLAMAAVAGVGEPGAERLAIGVAAALTLASGLGVVVNVALTDAIAQPVNELRLATERVAAGDLQTPVPVIAGDELGLLAVRFNEMLGDLRERDALRTQLRVSRARVVTASDAARRDVERDLHDGAQQHLVLLALKLGLLERLVAQDDPGAAVLAAEANADVGEALRALRELARGIYPAVLEADGLGGALADAARRLHPAAVVACDGVGRHGAEIEAAVYFCCAEALQNAAKHAGDGTRVVVRIAEDEDALTFEVSDDGAGFDAVLDGSDAGTGLRGMHDRVGAVGGRLLVTSRPGVGTRVTGIVPLAATAAVSFA